MNKVAKITLGFWIMKICATTLGETGGDLLAQTLNVGYALSTLILMGTFLVSVVFKLRSKEYNPILYWTVILTTSTAGTTMSDFLDRTLKLGYAKGSLLLITLLIFILVIWFLSEKSLSVANIDTTKNEIFYWSAILVSNTLGTALGDFLSDDSGLGFMGGAILIGGIILLIILLNKYTKINKIFLFWSAFILTRPFGATFGDLLTKPISKGGLDLGTMGSSAVLFIILVLALIVHTIKWKKDKITLEPIN